MKSKFTQRRYRVPKRSACALCKPQKQGWADKKTFADVRRAVAHEQQYDMRGRRWMDCIGRVALRPSGREIASQMRDWDSGCHLPTDH
jgi:hypothetical protein